MCGGRSICLWPSSPPLPWDTVSTDCVGAKGLSLVTYRRVISSCSAGFSFSPSLLLWAGPSSPAVGRDPAKSFTPLDALTDLAIPLPETLSDLAGATSSSDGFPGSEALLDVISAAFIGCLTTSCLPVVPSGLLVVPSGLLVVPSGLLVVSSGLLVVPSGLLVVPSGLLVVPSGLLVVPSGLLVVPSGLLVVPSGLLVVPSGLLVVPSGLLEVPCGSVLLSGEWSPLLCMNFSDSNCWIKSFSSAIWRCLACTCEGPREKGEGMGGGGEGRGMGEGERGWGEGRGKGGGGKGWGEEDGGGERERGKRMGRGERGGGGGEGKRKI